MAAIKTKILLVEDDPGMQKQLGWGLEEFDLITSADRESALSELRRHEPSVVIQDLGLPPDPEGVTEGLRCLSEIMELAPHTKVVVVTGHGDQDNAVNAVGMGAYDFLAKPIDIDLLKLVIRRASYIYDLEKRYQLLLAHTARSPLEGVIATTEPMLKVCRMVERVAPTQATVLLLGDSGTGKEVLARAIHGLSDRAQERFVAINCAAIPDTLLESELFGYEKGAFTGAAKQTPGKIEHANGGTLFLDEIGDMPLPLQAKLLRFLQERVVERLGGREEIPVDVRVLCATNKNLESLVEQELFRNDLFYRVSEVTVDIPPLQERGADKIVIARFLLQKSQKQLDRIFKGFAPSAIKAIEAYAWPGNVREMENRITRATIMADSKQISAEDLGLDQQGETDLQLNLKQVRSNAESSAIKTALEITENNITKAAQLLGITRPTLYSLLERYDLQMSVNEG